MPHPCRLTLSSTVLSLFSVFPKGCEGSACILMSYPGGKNESFASSSHSRETPMDDTYWVSKGSSDYPWTISVTIPQKTGIRIHWLANPRSHSSPTSPTSPEAESPHLQLKHHSQGVRQMEAKVLLPEAGKWLLAGKEERPSDILFPLRATPFPHFPPWQQDSSL